MKKLLPAALVLAAASIAACSSDEKVGPVAPVDTAECTVGTISPNATREFTLGGAVGCATLDLWNQEDDTVRAASHTVRLEANRLYAFRATEKNGADTSSFDLTMSLFGPGADTTAYGWLSASDDEWGGASSYAPVLYYVPQQSGSFAVRVSGYNPDDTARVVQLVARTCPLGPTIAGATTGTTTSASIVADGCVASSGVLPLEDGVDSTRIAFLRVTLPANATRRLRVIATAFHPTVRFVGPGGNLWAIGEEDVHIDNAERVTSDTANFVVTAPSAGTYSLFVGAAQGVRTGAFKVLVDTATAGEGNPLLPSLRRDAKRGR